MKRITIITILAGILLIGLVSAYSVGTEFTQQQLDGITITRSSVFIDGNAPTITKVTGDDRNLYVHYEIIGVEQNQTTGKYYTYADEKKIILNRNNVRLCIDRFGKANCVNNIIMPYIRQKAVKQIDRQVERIEELKTQPTEEISVNDLGSLI